MSHALRAEWTKLRTMPSTGWLALAVIVFTVGIGAAVTATADVSHCPTPTTCFEDTTKLSLMGVRLGQIAVVVLAVLAISNEYGTRMIHATLTSIPQRTLVLASKFGVVTAVTLAAGSFGVIGSILAGRAILPGNGFTPANGYPPLSLADGSTLRAAVGSVLYLALIALLSLSIGVVIRDTAGSLTATFALLFLFPLIAMFVSNPLWQQRLQRYSPMNAGLAIQATRDLSGLPIGPWPGLSVLAAYAATAMVIGLAVFHWRDA